MLALMLVHKVSVVLVLALMLVHKVSAVLVLALMLVHKVSAVLVLALKSFSASSQTEHTCSSNCEKSVVWKYCHKKEPKTAQCTLCDKEYASHVGTSNLS